MRADTRIPVLPAKRRGALQRVARHQAQPRARLHRLEPPAQLELDAARRIVERLVQRDRDGTDALDDPPGTQHAAALLRIAHAGGGAIRRTEHGLRIPPSAGNDGDERLECLGDGAVGSGFVLLARHDSSMSRRAKG